MPKRTMRGWWEYLDDPKRELDLNEFMALMLFNIREYALQTLKLTEEIKAAGDHTEGMLGAIDQLAEQIAANAGLPYAASSTVRAALDIQRDELRRLAAEQRAKALAG